MAKTSTLQTSIAPWLSVRSSTRAVAFYKAAFNAVETYRLEDPDGNAIVKLSIDKAEFWVSNSSENNNEKENLGGSPVRMILVIDDPDTLFAQALKAGATEVFPASEEHGWRLGRLIDICGLHWEIGKELDTL